MRFDPQFRGCVHHIAGRRLFASRGSLILTGFAGEPLRVLARLPLGAVDSVSGASRVLGRLLRREVSHITLFRDRVVVIAFGRIWCLDAESGALLGDPVALVGMRPFALCVTPHGMYYGEYRRNPERAPIRVLFSDDGLSWSTVRELRGVRHIHGIYYDEFTSSVWVTTGDEDAESVIWHSPDRFASLKPVISGSQQTRAIPLLFTREHVLFGSDTPLEQNFLYRLERSTGRLTELAPVEGSVFYAARVGAWMLFSTAVEPSEANRSRDAVLYASRDGERWSVLARHPKDRWPVSYCQFGQIILPGGHNETRQCWYSTFGVGRDYAVHAGAVEAAERISVSNDHSLESVSF